MTTIRRRPRKASNMASVARTSEIFRSKLRNAIEARHFGQSEFAEQIGVSRQVLHSFLNGTAPKPDMLARIGIELDVSLDWLCNDAHQNTTPEELQDRDSIQNIPREELAGELARRVRMDCLELRKLLRDANQMVAQFDWAALILLQLTQDAWGDQKARRLAVTAARIEQLAMAVFNAELKDHAFENDHWNLPGPEGVSVDELMPQHIAEQAEAFIAANPGVQALQWIVREIGPAFGNPRLMPDREYVRQERRRYVEALLQRPGIKGTDLAKQYETALEAESKAQRKKP